MYIIEVSLFDLKYFDSCLCANNNRIQSNHEGHAICACIAQLIFIPINICSTVYYIYHITKVEPVLTLNLSFNAECGFDVFHFVIAIN